MSYEEWLNIPETSDFSRKKTKMEKHYPVPDSVIEGGRRDTQIDNKIQEVEG